MLAIWKALSLQQKATAVIAVAVVVGLMSMLVRGSTKPQMALLYAGVDPAVAGEIVSELEGLGVEYEVRGQSVYTDVRRRDELRIQLAQQGLPKAGGDGYELLDNLNSFAMTSEMFNSAYWRATQGELAQTIMSMPAVNRARVHIGTAKKSGFSNTPSARTASVTVTTSSRLDPQQAKAIQYMTALAISGLTPEDVAVIDTAYGLVAGPGMSNVMGGASSETDRAARVEQALLSLLEARVGIGNARVSVAMELDMQHEVISERVVDPESRVIKMRSVNEVTDNQTGTDVPVTVASNLPEGEAGAGTSSSDRSETSEQTEYEMSEVRRDAEKLPGAVTRMTVAVLVNDAIEFGDDGEIIRQPRTPEELEALRELVSAAAGIDAERGDLITIKNLAFNLPPEIVEVAAPSLVDQLIERYFWSAAQAVFIGIVVMVLGVFVIRPLFTQRPIEEPPMQIAEQSDELDELAMLEQGGFPTMDELPEEEEDALDKLKALTADQPDDAATLLMSWLDEGKKAAS